jgi:hypothetical protein
MMAVSVISWGNYHKILSWWAFDNLERDPIAGKVHSKRVFHFSFVGSRPFAFLSLSSASVPAGSVVWATRPSFSAGACPRQFAEFFNRIVVWKDEVKFKHGCISDVHTWSERGSSA